MSSMTKFLVPNELFAPAESSYFQGSFELEELIAGPDTYRASEPFVWEITVSNTGDALLISGTIAGTVYTACARCLEEFSLSLKGEIEGYYLLNEGEEAPEEMDEDEFEVLPEDKTIDLEPLFTAALLLELPLVPLCDEACKGLCMQCGANLNEEACGCVQPEEEPKESPFAVLKDFPFDK